MKKKALIYQIEKKDKPRRRKQRDSERKKKQKLKIIAKTTKKMFQLNDK